MSALVVLSLGSGYTENLVLYGVTTVVVYE